MAQARGHKYAVGTGHAGAGSADSVLRDRSGHAIGRPRSLRRRSFILFTFVLLLPGHGGTKKSAVVVNHHHHHGGKTIGRNQPIGTPQTYYALIILVAIVFVIVVEVDIYRLSRFRCGQFIHFSALFRGRSVPSKSAALIFPPTIILKARNKNKKTINHREQEEYHQPTIPGSRSDAPLPWQQHNN
jgi:hypothetical protein